MAEFLIRVHDKVNADSPYLDAACMKAGDVVVVCADAWQWSKLEETLDSWRIVKVPGMTLSEAEAFLTPEIGDAKVNRMLQRRQFKFNLSLLDPAFVADDSRKAPFATVDVTVVRLAKILKPPLLDPAVLG